jgi:hypothetical protein
VTLFACLSKGMGAHKLGSYLGTSFIWLGWMQGMESEKK